MVLLPCVDETTPPTQLSSQCNNAVRGTRAVLPGGRTSGVFLVIGSLPGSHHVRNRRAWPQGVETGLRDRGSGPSRRASRAPAGPEAGGFSGHRPLLGSGRRRQGRDREPPQRMDGPSSRATASGSPGSRFCAPWRMRSRGPSGRSRKKRKRKTRRRTGLEIAKNQGASFRVLAFSRVRPIKPRDGSATAPDPPDEL